MDLSEVRRGDIIVVSGTHTNSRAIHIVSLAQDNDIYSYASIVGKRTLCNGLGLIRNMITKENVSIRLANDNEVDEIMCALKGEGYKWDLNLKRLKIIGNERFENRVRRHWRSQGIHF